MKRKGIISQKREISTIELGGRLGGTWAVGRAPRENFLFPTVASFCDPPPPPESGKRGNLCIVACLGVVSFGEEKLRDGGEPGWIIACVASGFARVRRENWNESKKGMKGEGEGSRLETLATQARWITDSV